MWLLAAFLAIPLIEIGLFIQIGGAIGLWPTLAIVVITAGFGSWLVRTQGMMAMGQLRSSFSELRDPTEPLAHGAMILFSGALLLTPGFFTDAVGFALLFPPVRTAVYKWGGPGSKSKGFRPVRNLNHNGHRGLKSLMESSQRWILRSFRASLVTLVGPGIETRRMTC